MIFLDDVDALDFLNTVEDTVERFGIEVHAYSLMSKRKIMPSWPNRKKKRHGVDEYGRTTLWQAAFSGNLKTVKKSLSSGGGLKKEDAKCYIPLHVASVEILRVIRLKLSCTE